MKVMLFCKGHDILKKKYHIQIIFKYGNNNLMFTNINNYDMIGMPKKYRKAIKGGLTFVHKLLMNKCKIEMNILNDSDPK
jgi:hypothetical protein